MNTRYIFSSLTRISPLEYEPFEVRKLPRNQWLNGDYVVGKISHPPNGHRVIELASGRMMPVMPGDLIVGALGKRRATLEVTGTWEKVGEDGAMHVLTGAGLFGKLVSASPFSDTLMRLQYQGHVFLSDQRATMSRYVKKTIERPFTSPVILLVGTSMSAGKTTSARIIVRQLKDAGLQVLGAKLTGAGRYRDIQGMADAGADHIFDFVDAGLPSSIYPADEYEVILRQLLSRMAAVSVDASVIEIGSSPLEPYNGEVAIDAIRDNICATVLCASDPYAVIGVMTAYKMNPTLVTGPATNTSAGIELIQKLCSVPTLNLLDPDSLPQLNDVLLKALQLEKS
jgi:hypothetical protein